MLSKSLSKTFYKNRETLEDQLTRKLSEKYLDCESEHREAKEKYIRSEVHKFIKTEKCTGANLKALDHRVFIEMETREEWPQIEEEV